MADITKLKSLLDAYGVAVRAGVITPCIEDEKEMRKRFGLPDMSPAIVANWKLTDNIRRPITIQEEHP